eukprot:Hpha_TRINITY_DN32814_c0_g1::TRINITY_DN32814_c0_g1_i1::g.87268::m.87268
MLNAFKRLAGVGTDQPPLGGVMGRLLELDESAAGPNQSLAGVAKRAALIAQQEQARASSDVIMKLHRIYDNLSPRMQQTVRKHRQQLRKETQDSAKKVLEEHQREKAHNQRAHALDQKKEDPAMTMMEPLLLELKTLFEEQVDGRTGIAEDEFVSTFAPAFLPNATQEQRAQWFTGIDYDADGR